MGTKSLQFVQQIIVLKPCSGIMLTVDCRSTFNLLFTAVNMIPVLLMNTINIQEVPRLHQVSLDFVF